MEEAPKYRGKLTKNLVKTFLNKLFLWAGARSMSSNSLKCLLAISFSNDDANRWFTQNMHIVYDQHISYERLCQIFLEEAPFCFENNLTLSELQSEKQKQTESTSSFILRILCEAGDTFYNATESSWVDAFVRNVYYKVSDYLDIRGRPANIAQLKVLVREYELHKDSRPIANEPRHQNGIDLAVTDLKATLSIICQELAEIKQSALMQSQPLVEKESNMGSRNQNTSEIYRQPFDSTDFGQINQVKFGIRDNEGLANKSCPLLMVTINSHQQEALIDSGAYCSLVGFGIAKWFPRIQSSKINITSVTNFPIQNFGIALIPIKIGCAVITFPFVVVEDTTANLVLGSDFMTALKVSLNISAGILKSPIFGTANILPPRTNFLHIMNIRDLIKVEEHIIQNLPSPQVASVPITVTNKRLFVRDSNWPQNEQMTGRSGRNFTYAVPSNTIHKFHATLPRTNPYFNPG